MRIVETGTTYKSEEYLIDFGGNPIDGAVWELVSFDTPTGKSIPWDVDNLGSGFYLFSFTPLDPGYYDLVVQVRLQGQPIIYHIECAVEGAVRFGDPSKIALRDIRSMVARQMRDHRSITATSGSETTITDPFTLLDNTDHFRGGEFIVRKGHPENMGLKRKVVSSSYESATITFLPPLPQPVGEGDQFDIYNFSRVRATISDYDNAINDAIRQAHPQNREEMYYDVYRGYDHTIRGVKIPDGFIAVFGVQYQNEHGHFVDIDMLNGWDVDTVRRVIVPHQSWINRLTGSPVRIYGYGRARELEKESDMTTTDVEWIIDSAVGSLTTAMMDQATFPIGQSRSNRADQLRGKMAFNTRPNTISLE